MRTKTCSLASVLVLTAFALAGPVLAQDAHVTNTSHEVVVDTSPNLDSCDTFYSVIPIKELDGSISSLIFPTDTLQVVTMKFTYQHKGSPDTQVQYLTSDSPNVNIRSCKTHFRSHRNVRGPNGFSILEPEGIYKQSEPRTKSS